MRTLVEWRQLACPCGSVTFGHVVHLRWNSAGTGTTTEPAGWRCADCGKPVDTAELIRLLQLVEKQKELKSLQEELGEHATA